MSTEEESKQHEQSNSNLLEIPSGKLCSDCHDLKKAAKSLRQMTFSVDDDADSVDLDENKTISSLKPADSVMLTKEHFRKKSEESNAGTDISLTDLDVFSEKKSFENKHEENEKDKAVAFDEKLTDIDTQKETSNFHLNFNEPEVVKIPSHVDDTFHIQTEGNLSDEKQVESLDKLPDHEHDAITDNQENSKADDAVSDEPRPIEVDQPNEKSQPTGGFENAQESSEDAKTVEDTQPAEDVHKSEEVKPVEDIESVDEAKQTENIQSEEVVQLAEGISSDDNDQPTENLQQSEEVQSPENFDHTADNQQSANNEPAVDAQSGGEIQQSENIQTAEGMKISENNQPNEDILLEGEVPPVEEVHPVEEAQPTKNVEDSQQPENNQLAVEVQQSENIQPDIPPDSVIKEPEIIKPPEDFRAAEDIQQSENIQNDQLEEAVQGAQEVQQIELISPETNVQEAEELQTNQDPLSAENVPLNVEVEQVGSVEAVDSENTEQPVMTFENKPQDIHSKSVEAGKVLDNVIAELLTDPVELVGASLPGGKNYSHCYSSSMISSNPIVNVPIVAPMNVNVVASIDEIYENATKSFEYIFNAAVESGKLEKESFEKIYKAVFNPEGLKKEENSQPAKVPESVGFDEKSYWKNSDDLNKEEVGNVEVQEKQAKETNKEFLESSEEKSILLSPGIQELELPAYALKSVEIQADESFSTMKNDQLEESANLAVINQEPSSDAVNEKSTLPAVANEETPVESSACDESLVEDKSKSAENVTPSLDSENDQSTAKEEISEPNLMKTDSMRDLMGSESTATLKYQSDTESSPSSVFMSETFSKADLQETYQSEKSIGSKSIVRFDSSTLMSKEDVSSGESFEENTTEDQINQNKDRNDTDDSLAQKNAVKPGSKTQLAQNESSMTDEMSNVDVTASSSLMVETESRNGDFSSTSETSVKSDQQPLLSESVELLEEKLDLSTCDSVANINNPSVIMKTSQALNELEESFSNEILAMEKKIENVEHAIHDFVENTKTVVLGTVDTVVNTLTPAFMCELKDTLKKRSCHCYSAMTTREKIDRALDEVKAMEKEPSNVSLKVDVGLNDQLMKKMATSDDLRSISHTLIVGAVPSTITRQMQKENLAKAMSLIEDINDDGYPDLGIAQSNTLSEASSSAWIDENISFSPEIGKIKAPEVTIPRLNRELDAAIFDETKPRIIDVPFEGIKFRVSEPTTSTSDPDSIKKHGPYCRCKKFFRRLFSGV